MMASAQESAPTDQELVPQQLLGLVHAPQVHRELNLSDQQVASLEKLFGEIDGYWFRARNLKPTQRIEVIKKLETRVQAWFASNTPPDTQQRLKQLEYRAQGMRMLLNPELADQLKMSATQTKKFKELARNVDSATAKLAKATMRNEVTEDVKTAVKRAIDAENGALKTVMQPAQLQQLQTLLGAAFDTTALKRIYPMAPELVSAENWINSDPLTLRELRGKVVIVHFYAFQCHNCHANFKHYDRWHKDLNSDEVVVLGIQTPETRLEADPGAVREAAKKRGIQYPVLVDLDKGNWNAWSNTMWPTVYIVDKKGYLRHWWQGELNWNGATGDQKIDELVASLLREEA